MFASVILILPALLKILLYIGVQTTIGWAGRLFGMHPKVVFVPVNGFFLAPVIIMLLSWISIFLFGTARVRR